MTTKSPKKTEDGDRKPKWFERQRLIAIDTYLSHLGFWQCAIGVNQFSITLKQAVRDIATYTELFSGERNVKRDYQRHCYVRLSSFKSIYSEINPEFPYPPNDLLLQQLKPLTQLPDHIEIYKHALLPSNRQRMLPEVVATLYQCITQNIVTNMTFATTRRPDGEQMEIIGHTLFFAGEWYLRAFNLGTGKYHNYFVPRVLAAEATQKTAESVIDGDTEWNQRVLINVQLKSDEDEELFYRLYNLPRSGNGVGILDTRKAMANELLSQMHLASYPDPQSRTQLKVGPIEEISQKGKFRKDLLWSN